MEKRRHVGGAQRKWGERVKWMEMRAYLLLKIVPSERNWLGTFVLASSKLNHGLDGYPGMQE